MKRLLHLSLSLVLALAATLPAAAEMNHLVGSLDGIIYTLYYEGSGPSAVAKYAEVTRTSTDFNGIADIRSSVTFQYSYLDQDYNVYTIELTAPVTSIGYCAFYYYHPRQVIIPNSVVTIGDRAFEGSSNLTSVTIGSSVSTIGSYAFSGCTSLPSITLPNSVTTIGLSAFSNCSSLSSITIPNSVTTIGIWAFGGCSGLTRLIIGNSVSTIGEHAFIGCRSLSSLTIPNSVITIGGGAFENCYGLSSVTIGNSLTTISAGMFKYCGSLTHVTIGNTVTTIDKEAFYGCGSLPSVVIPNSVITIGNDSFRYCKNMKSLIIGSSVNSIGLRAFEDCDSLTSITCLAVTPPSVNPNYDTFPYHSATLYVPSGSLYEYMTTAPWQYFYSILPIEQEYSISLDESSVTIPIFSTVQLHATVTPDDENTPSVTWSSSHPAVATVSQDGLVKGCMTGTATITAKAGQSTATCLVTVTPILATEIVLNVSQLTMEVGDIYSIVATVYPANVTNGQVAWIVPSSDAISASWQGNECQIIAKNGGTVTIGARTTDGTNLAAYCTVTVKPPFIMATSISLDLSKLTMNVNEMHQLHATVLPIDATNKTVAWSSSNTSVVTVTSYGMVKALRAGTAVITAATTDGSQLKAQCQVIVVGGGTPSSKPGDVNGDGKVDVNDMTALVQYLLTGDSTGINLDNADVNGDGKVDINDINSLYNLLDGTQTIMTGDADGSGKVDINDLTTIIKYLLNGDSEHFNLINSDVDGDGRVTIDDVTSLINLLLGNN